MAGPKAPFIRWSCGSDQMSGTRLVATPDTCFWCYLDPAEQAVVDALAPELVTS